MTENVKQGRIVGASADRSAWLEERRKNLGASDMAAILGLNPRTTPWQVWADKTGRLEPEPSTAAQRAGLLYERAILDYAEDVLGDADRDVLVTCPTAPMAATCDAIIRSTGHPVEAKTTGITGPVFGDWGEEFSDDVPEYYAIQVHAQLVCTRAEIAHLFALVAGRGTLQFVIERNDRIADILQEHATRWWDTHIVRDIPPDITSTPSDVVKRLRREEGKRIQLPSLDLLDQYEQARQQRLDAEKIEDAAKAALLSSLGDAELGEASDGRLVSFKQTTRNEKAREARVIQYRTLRVKHPRK